MSYLENSIQIFFLSMHRRLNVVEDILLVRTSRHPMMTILCNKHYYLSMLIILRNNHYYLSMGRYNFHARWRALLTSVMMSRVLKDNNSTSEWRTTGAEQAGSQPTRTVLSGLRLRAPPVRTMRRHRQDRDRPVEQPNRCRTPTHEQEEEEDDESSSAAASLLAECC
jgi:hypothetical protein